jgi:hypothetical protein
MSIGSLSIAKTASDGRPPFHLRPRVWILLIAILAVVVATLYVMATDHTGLGMAH